MGCVSRNNKNTEAHNHTQPPTMASSSSSSSSSPDSNWECGACTHPNKGGKYCIMCTAALPKHQAVAAAPAPVVVAASARAPAPSKQPSGIILDVVGTAGTDRRHSCKEHECW